jgi:hypothetical protein
VGWTSEAVVFRFTAEALFSKSSTIALPPKQAPFQWVQGALSVGLKRSGRKRNRLSASSPPVKNEWSYTFTAAYAFIARRGLFFFFAFYKFRVENKRII